MGIVGNYSVLHKTPGRFLSGPTISCNRPNFSQSGSLRNRFLSSAKFSAIPNGYVHPYTWAMAQVSGGLASYEQIEARLEKTNAILALGINIDANLNATLVEQQAILALIVALVSSITASGTISDANMAIILLLEADLIASGIISTAQLGNILGLFSSLSASGTLSPDVTNLVNLSAVIGGPAELSPQGLAEAVWNYLTSNPTTVGSMKEVIEGLTSGGGSSDWTATEKSQIRNRLGIDGTVLTPSATPTLATASELSDVKKNTNLIPAAL